MNQPLSRRHTFWLPVGLFFATALEGCQQLGQATSALPQFAQDATLIASSLGTIADAVGGIAGVPAALLAKIKSGVSTVQQLAASITASAAGGASSVTGLIGGFGSTVSGLLSSIGGISLHQPGELENPLSWVSTGLSAVSALLPTILAVAGVVLAGPAPVMTATAARAYLAGLQPR